MITTDELRTLASLREYSDRELEVLLGAARPSRFGPGVALCEEGGAGASCFFIVTGEVEVIRKTPEGLRAIAKQGPGAIVGHMALIERTPRSATVRALVQVTALEFSRADFDTLIQACSPFAIRFQEQIAVAGIRQLRRATEELIEILAAEDKASGDASATPAPNTTEALRYISTATNEWALPMVRKPKGEKKP